MIKIGVVGTGKWGINHIKSLKRLDCELVGICDSDRRKEKIADENGCAFFTDYKELLKDVDAVTIVTPTDTHYRIVKDCLCQGVNVLVEKPITLDADKAKELIVLAERSNLVLSVGYLYRFNSSIIRLRELLKDIGRIQYISMRYIHSTKPPRSDVGVIFNLGIHPIDILNFILDRRPERVYAKKKNLLSDSLEDSAVILLDYIDFYASIEVSCTHPEKKRDMWIIAENEKVYVDYFNQKVTRYPLKINYDGVEKGEPIEERIVVNEPLLDELRYFIKLVEDKNSGKIMDRNIGREEYYTTRICELALKSAESGSEMVI